MSDPYQEALWIDALRYYLGRKTYAVSDFCEALRFHWGNFSTELQEFISMEVERAIKENKTGMDMDT